MFAIRQRVFERYGEQNMTEGVGHLSLMFSAFLFFCFNFFVVTLLAWLVWDAMRKSSYQKLAILTIHSKGFGLFLLRVVLLEIMKNGGGGGDVS